MVAKAKKSSKKGKAKSKAKAKPSLMDQLNGLFKKGKEKSAEQPKVENKEKLSLQKQLKQLISPPKPILGIDISSMAIKLLELSRKGGQITVESYSVEPLPPGAVAEHNINDVEAVGEAIMRAIKRAKTKTKDAAVAVPGSAVITKTIVAPGAPNDDEMESQIELEAPKYIPFPLDEVNLDFEVLGPSATDPEMVDVLLVASRSENVDLRAAALELADLTPRVIDVETYALEHAMKLIGHQMPNQGHAKTIALVDVGANMTSVSVLHDMEIIYTREQDFGGKQLTEEIMRRFGLSYEEAGLAKRVGGLPDNYGPEVLEPFKASMAQQVMRALQFFYASSEQHEVDQVILAGGSAAIVGIAEYISSQVDVPVTVANPFAHMALSKKVKAQLLAADAPALMTACGLAVRGFD